MDDIYDNIDNYNPKRMIPKNMIADVMTNKKFQAIIKGPFIRSRKINISLCFLTQSYFTTPKDVN